MAKELFADYVKEKKLREPEEKKELAQTVKTFHVEARKKGFVQTIIRFGFCDIQNNQGRLSKGYQPQPSASASADNPYLDLDYSGYHKKPYPIIVYNPLA